ncbi:(deoxy)nucleoside triphosphate pyrophosphohydrolase [Porphyromonas sp.]|uniref:(deoxy)nucleoside triphosphate pyrophosphohydrolase n=1 Tax=Porphyromonas sp. TaxID=1924944 RepID=UPI0026DA8BDB|nr:(deoxy)nucleoside triphosphate pyrophosphohydrolase [Porphyromonas sp.]MDO4770868.1 (deoxy)nucleoside triphosphate pyrophosphohydrolase [Porphyromonas sp.]
MKRIEVVAAIIRDGDMYLATQRKGGEWDGYWEFPGGKIEAGETHQEALLREIREELDVLINIGDRLCTVEYDYPTFHLTMHCYLCALSEGEPKLSDHKAMRKLKASELHTLTWLPADIEVVAHL